MNKFTQRTSETPTEMMFSDDNVNGYCFLSTSYLSGSMPSTPQCIISLTPHIYPGSGTDPVDGNSKSVSVTVVRSNPFLYQSLNINLFGRKPPILTKNGSTTPGTIKALPSVPL